MNVPPTAEELHKFLCRFSNSKVKVVTPEQKTLDIFEIEIETIGKFDNKSGGAAETTTIYLKCEELK